MLYNAVPEEVCTVRKAQQKHFQINVMTLMPRSVGNIYLYGEYYKKCNAVSHILCYY